jgi:hypothetical protein
MKAKTRFCIKLAGTGGIGFLSLCLASTSSTSSPLFAQSVTFAGALTALQFTGGTSYPGLAIDSVGDVFITDSIRNLVYELPHTQTGYGPQITLPFSGLNYPYGIAVDSADNVFVADSVNNRMVELPRTETGYGAQITLPSAHLSYPESVAMDNAGDLFVCSGGEAYELPRSGTEFGPQITLPALGGECDGVAVDGAGDVFVAQDQKSWVVELPWSGNSYGPLTRLAWGLPTYTLAADNAGDVFVGTAPAVVELPRTKTGYGRPMRFDQFGTVYAYVLALDSAGNVFIVPSLGSSSNSNVVELQLHTMNLGEAYVCAPGQTTSGPCSQTTTLNYNVTASGTLGTPQVLNDGAPDLDFTLASGSTCMGEVTAGSTCTVNVNFAPSAIGTRRGEIEITDGAGTVLAALPIYGIGVSTTETPVAQVSTNYIRFHTVPLGTADYEPLTVTNIGAGILTVAPSFTTYSDRQSHQYTVDVSGCGGGLIAGYYCNLWVVFSPTSIATHYGLLTLQTNGETNPTIGLRGAARGLSVLGGVSGGSFKFGSVSSGSTEVLPLTVTNVGLRGTVTIGTTITVRATTRPTTTYKVLTTAGNTCLAGIAAGQSCTLPIEFAPTTSGIHDDLLTLTPSARGGGDTTVWLTGSTP